MYSRLILILLLAFSIFLLLRWFTRLPPGQATKLIRRLLFTAAVILLFFLAATGRLHWLFAIIASVLPLLRRWILLLLSNLPLLRAMYQRYRSTHSRNAPPSGQSSAIETHYLRLYLDHDSGKMSGEVLQGNHKDSRLENMGFDQLLQLLEECRANDTESVPLLETFLDREHGEQWSNHQSSGNARGDSAPKDNNMSTDEAYQILGLSPGATREEIVATHRRLMQKLHPDRGGSDWLATKLNQAKDLLLED
ncbi:MAG: DnaJ domain-containing protein [Gammaproteobacteria bacterium]|nr:DnaJ domain-containing protein [Gammaproteobacteria bacterium]